MKALKILTVLLVIFFLVGEVCSSQLEGSSRKKVLKNEIGPRPLNEVTPKKVRRYLRKYFYDSGKIIKNLFDMRSMKVITGVYPFYIIGRWADPHLQAKFYDPVTQTNIHQAPRSVKILFEDVCMAIPFIYFSSQGFAHRNPVERRAAQLFVTGFLWAWGSKVLAKQFKHDGAIRPPHEDFDQSKPTHGGSPSGHSAMASFMATYWGMYKGKKYGIPLGLYTGLIMGIAVTGNYHYISQAIAGAGLGILFGVAANKSLGEILKEEIKVSFDFAQDRHGNPGFKISYDF